MSGKPVTEDGRAQLPGAAPAGVLGRLGRWCAFSPLLVPGSSGLGDLLTPGGAGREPGSGALLRTKAVLILQEGQRSTVSA